MERESISCFDTFRAKYIHKHSTNDLYGLYILRNAGIAENSGSGTYSEDYLEKMAKMHVEIFNELLIYKIKENGFRNKGVTYNYYNFSIESIDNIEVLNELVIDSFKDDNDTSLL